MKRGRNSGVWGVGCGVWGVGRWGDGEMGRWGDGEMGELLVVRDQTGLPWFSGCWHRLEPPSGN
ncbi:MAG: hypothetical protein F6K26_42055 [Moorea sp. SIO2I5]|nr:hypothetical protein [Moorena sp. SIO2I5]